MSLSIIYLGVEKNFNFYDFFVSSEVKWNNCFKSSRRFFKNYSHMWRLFVASAVMYDVCLRSRTFRRKRKLVKTMRSSSRKKPTYHSTDAVCGNEILQRKKNFYASLAWDLLFLIKLIAHQTHNQVHMARKSWEISCWR